MGIDLRQSRQDCFDRNIYYKRKYIDNMKLVKNAKPEGVFYSYDKVPLQTSTVTLGSVKKTRYTITIETRDVVKGLQVDDFILYPDGNLYIVEDIIATDKNEEKEFSRRPSYVTEIRMRR